MTFAPDYSKAQTLLRGLKTFAVYLALVVTALETEDFKTSGVLIGILTLYRILDNVRKNGNGPSTPGPMFAWTDVKQWFVLLWDFLKSCFTNAATVLICILLAGCVSTRFKDTVTKPTGEVQTVEYKATSSAWPFGKVDSSVHKMDTQFGAAKMSVGQDASGIDNTASAEVIRLLLNLLTTKP